MTASSTTDTSGQAQSQQAGFTAQGNAERQQAIVRVAFTVLIGAYIYSIHFFELFGGIPLEPVVCITVYTLAAIAIVIWNLFSPAPNSLRKVVCISLDTISATYIMITGGLLTACIYGGYLWVSLANGLRFGKGYMMLAYIQSIVGFSVVLIFSDFWRDNLEFGIGLMIWILLLPLYVYKLLIILEKAMQATENANKAKSQFLANMSHEMRTPLTSIIGFAEEGLEHDARQNRHILRTIKQSGDYLLTLINELLDFSKAEANELEIKLQPCQLFEITENVKAIFQRTAKNKNLDFVVEYNFPLPAVINTDPLRLKQILINLSGNAIKFTEQGFVKIAVNYLPESDQIVLSVLDSGIGIAHNQLNTIFEPFKQVDESMSRRYSGTGLGLAISKKLSQLLNGVLEVKSDPNVGTEFKLALTCGGGCENLVYELPALPATENRAVSKATPKLTGKVLLAEDNEINQRLLKALLNRLGVSLTIVGDGISAVDHALHSSFDLILMDIQMPGLSGIEAVTRLRSMAYDKPVVALTANALADNQRACLEAGFDGFLTKPIVRAELYAMCQRYLKDDKGDRPVIISGILDQEPELLDLVCSFVDKLPDMLSKLNRLAHDKSWGELSALIHDLKGLGGSFGYPDISRLAGEIEKCVKEQPCEQLPDMLDNLQDVVTRVSAGLQEYKINHQTDCL